MDVFDKSIGLKIGTRTPGQSGPRSFFEMAATSGKVSQRIV